VTPYPFLLFVNILYKQAEIVLSIDALICLLGIGINQLLLITLIY